MKMITKFENWSPIAGKKIGMINEIKLPILKIEEILDSVSVVSNNLLKSLLVGYYKTHAEYIDLVDKKKHLFKVNDISGDILNSTRVTFDVMVFDDNDIKTIQNNIVRYAINEFYDNLPEMLDIFGIQIKPLGFIDKPALKATFEGTITADTAIEVITGITGFSYEKKHEAFHIWVKK
jgi:hypothetical protein